MVKSEPKFWEPERDISFSLEELKNVDSELQKDVMRHWFISNYENPAEHTPYESSEGGYTYIWGGPYNAREELGELFGGYVPEDVIYELVSELEAECVDWSGKISSESYDEYFYTVIYDNYEFTETLKNNLNSIKKLLKIDLPLELERQNNLS